MKLAIVHLSDIHFKSETDIGFRRCQKLANIIRFSLPSEEILLFVVSGDIANTGSAAEYVVAEKFFGTLFSSLGVHASLSPSPVVLVPGNHDCNFGNPGDLRPRLLSEIAEQLNSIDEKGEIVQTLLRVQAGFFEFVEKLTNENIPTDEQLFFVKKFTFGSETLEFRCFNSAWLSNRHEQAGSLGFPSSVIDRAASKTDSDFVISVVHHPHNWLSPTSYQDFRKVIQSNSDFLITGHEHLAGGQLVAAFSGSHLIHIESGSYQPPNSGESDFGILHLDLSERTWRQERFKWSDGAYVKLHDGEPQTLSEKSERAKSLQLSSAILRYLTDDGTGFLHPRLQKLTLPDIYIYPDLKTRSISKLRRLDDLPSEIRSAQLAEKILSANRVVIAGPTDSGKTALSKMLVLDGHTKHGRTCLLLCGKSIAKGKDPETAFLKAVDVAVSEHYGKDAKGIFAGLDVKQRVLVIDDWEHVHFNRAGRKAILSRACEQFGSVILMADDIFLIDELSRQYEDAPLETFEVVDIREFGYRLRGQLARKWHTLGDTYIEDEQTLARRISDSTHVIDTVVGRNLLPAYPVNIITLLQTYDAGAGSQNSGLGSYGQVYEALITARLAKVSIKSIDIGTKITVLARFAWRLFESGSTCLSQSEWSKLGDQYYQEYKIRLDVALLCASCIEAGLLSQDECGYRFTQGYGYCYFVAKYLQENLADSSEDSARDDLFDKLRGLSERVYNQNNANIVILYVFLTKDRSLINFVIENARKIFAESDEFDFDSHVAFVNTLVQPLAPLELPSGTAELHRQAYDQRRDEAGEQLDPRGDPSAGDVLYKPDLPFEQRLIIGIRYLTLMGQFLRNFPGSLKGATKLELAFESYSLGLRILSAVFGFCQKDSDIIVRDIAKVLRERMAFSGTDRELLDKAELILAELLREITYGLVKRISHAVGLSELEPTYDEVAELRDNNLSNKMIRLSILLDHFESFPKQEVKELTEILKKNTFSYQTLRDLVINHLYLFPRDVATQQWVGNTLKIKVNTNEVIGDPLKLRSE